jgi:hypothetical protein
MYVVPQQLGVREVRTDEEDERKKRDDVERKRREDEEERKKREEEQRKTREAEERKKLEECTFHPKILKRRLI